ncbi:hypothetical protein NLO98_21025 [Pseudomonas syringae]|nr:hypothetical protein [Pseudomonas syringae]
MADDDISKSFYGELTLASDDSKINFSYVEWTNRLTLPVNKAGDAVGDNGYEIKLFEYMTTNTFEHYAEKFYFKYSPSDNAYSLMLSDAGTKWIGITNNGYAWKTSDSTRCRHFQLVGEDKTTRLNLSDITEDNRKVYLFLTSGGTALCTYSKTTVKDHSWSYLTTPGDKGALFNLKILERSATWPRS